MGSTKGSHGQGLLGGPDIGPLKLETQKAGPGHYVIRRAELAPKGVWQLDVDARVTAFTGYTARLRVPIR